MKKRKSVSRLVSILTAFFICLMVLPLVTSDVAKAENRSGNFSTNYSLGNNPAQNMVNIAFAQEGKKGSQLGYNSDWCAWFVADCARLAGQDTIIPEKGRVRDLASAIKGEETSTPQVGDICIFDWNSVSGPYDHVEIVYKVSGSTVYTIGGNAGSTGSYKTNYVKTRNATATGQVQCYIHPFYNGASTPENDDELGIPYPRPSGNPLLSTGSRGSGVSWLQTALNKVNNAGLDVDGQFGSGTKQAVINFQKANGLEADGIAGPATVNKLVEVISIKSANLFKPSINLDKSYYTVEDTINISWNASPSESSLSHYWVQVISPDGSYLLDEAFNAQTTACSFLAHTIGDYTVKTFATPLGSNSGEGSLTDEKKVSVFERLAKPSIDFNKNYYTIGETVDITWKMSPPKSNISHYWVSIIAPDGSYLLDEAFNVNTASCSFEPLAIGEFKIKVYATPLGSVSGEGSEIDVKTVSVYDKISKPIINTNKEAYTVNDNVEISWKPSSENSNLSHYWLVVKDPDGTEIIGETMSKNTSYSFSASKSGEYIIITYATPIGSKEGEGSLTDTKTISVTKYIKGDINDDGKADIADLVMLQKWLLGSGDLTNWKNADLCEDGVIDAFDVAALRRLLLN